MITGQFEQLVVYPLEKHKTLFNTRALWLKALTKIIKKNNVAISETRILNFIDVKSFF